jgi:DNA repair ATPase RecN
MNRQQRRAEKKQQGKRVTKSNQASLAGLAGLTQVAGQLQDLLGAGEQMQEVAEQLQQVLVQVEAARDFLQETVDKANNNEYELAKQRWVTLRLVGTVNPVDSSDVAGLMALEEQYRAEYDVIQALIQLKQP